MLETHGLSPIRLSAKEGLALINGTQLITSLGAEAVERSTLIARQADVVAALTLEVLKGTSRAFDSDVQMIRPHKGQIAVAKRLRALLHSDTYPSQIAGILFSTSQCIFFTNLIVVLVTTFKFFLWKNVK